MNYQAFTDETLLMMHHGARAALIADDEMVGLGHAPHFRVRDTLNWTMHIAELEVEMARRSIDFEKIVWSSISDHPPQPLTTNPADGPIHLSARIASVMRIRKR